MKQNVKIVFQGDSITDAGRDRRNYYNLGKGYAMYASQKIIEAYPDVNFELINMGIGGNRTSQLFDRLYRDAIEFQPDIISVMIGINDIMHRHNADRIATSDERLEYNYRGILERLKDETNAKILMMQPFLLDDDSRARMREDLPTVLQIINKLADEYADVYVPLHEQFEEAFQTQPEPRYYSRDGVHPSDNGARFIAERYVEAILPLIKKL